MTCQELPPAGNGNFIDWCNSIFVALPTNDIILSRDQAHIYLSVTVNKYNPQVLHA